MEDKSKIASILKGIAVLTFIGAAILGIVLGEDHRGDFSFLIALIYWVAGFITGTMFLGFAAIIELLQDVVDECASVVCAIGNNPTTTAKDHTEIIKLLRKMSDKVPAEPETGEVSAAAPVNDGVKYSRFTNADAPLKAIAEEDMIVCPNCGAKQFKKRTTCGLCGGKM